MITLGYGVADFISAFLPAPGDPSQPFVLTDEQALFVLRWYAVDDRGRFIYRRAALQEAKGRGKSPVDAALAIAEFCGPVLFAGFNAKKRPVGRPWGSAGSPPPWVQIAASSEDQANSNVYSLIWEFLSVNEGKAAKDLGIDLGKTRLYLPSQPGAKLEAVTSAAGAREGQRVTFAVLDESHLWKKANGGLKLARVIRRNAAKMGGRTLESSNAHELGEGSVAEETADAAAAGQPGILYVGARPAAEPSPDASDDELLEVLREVYKGSPWVDPSRILLEVRDPATTWADALRYYFNIPSAGSQALIDPSEWDALFSDEKLEPEAIVSLAFIGADPSAAALIGCRAGHLFTLDIWERPDGNEDWRIPRGDVEEAMQQAFDRFTVALLYADPRGFHTELEGWADKWGDDVVVEYPTASPRRFAEPVDRFRVGIAERQFTHDGDPALARHVASARLKDTRSGHVLERPAPDRPIAGAIAAALALQAHADAPEVPDLAPLIS